MHNIHILESERVFTSHWDWCREMIPLRYSQAQKIMRNVRTCFQVAGQTGYSRCQGYVLHLVGPTRCGVLWAVKTEWNYHRRPASYTIHVFELCIDWRRSGHSNKRDTTELSSSMTMFGHISTYRKTGQDILGNAEMGGLTPPAILSRRCSFQLTFVSFDGTRPGSSAFPDIIFLL